MISLRGVFHCKGKMKQCPGHGSFALKGPAALCSHICPLIKYFYEGGCTGNTQQRRVLNIKLRQGSAVEKSKPQGFIKFNGGLIIFRLYGDMVHACNVCHTANVKAARKRKRYSQNC